MNLMGGTNNIFEAGGSCLLSELRAGAGASGVYCRSVMGGSNNTLCGLLNLGIFVHSTEWMRRPRDEQKNICGIFIQMKRGIIFLLNRYFSCFRCPCQEIIPLKTFKWEKL